MPRRRSIAAILKWATAIVAGASAFVGAAVGLNDQVRKAWTAFVGASPPSLDDNFTMVDDNPSADLSPAIDDPQNAIGNVDVVTPTPEPTGNPDDLTYLDRRYTRVAASFTVRPPEGVKEPIINMPCGCIRREDATQKVDIMNSCAGDAKIVFMKFPNYPLENQPNRLPVTDDRELRSDVTYSAVTLPPGTYARVEYGPMFLIDAQVTQC